MNQEKNKKSKPNFYLTLDLMPGASHNDILHAYNRAKNTYSSGSLASYTLIEDETNGEILEDIEIAFAILGNPAKRRAYDIEMGFSTWSEDPQNNVSTEYIQSPRVSSLKTSNAMDSDLEDIEKDQSRVVIPLKAKAPVQTSNAQKASQKMSSSPTAVSSQFEPNPDFEAKIQSVTEIDGAFLKAVRIYRCYSPDTLAHRCKLSSTHIIAIEEEDGPQLHQPVYLRGHIFLICQALEIPNPQLHAKNYVDRMTSLGKLQIKKNY